MDMEEEKNNQPVVVYSDIDTMLSDLNAKDSGKHFTCTCPACGKDEEGYIYKNNLNFVFCNRKNNCGETTKLAYERKNEKTLERLRIEKRNASTLSELQYRELEHFSKLMSYIVEHTAGHNDPSCNHLRGISRGNYLPHMVCFPDDKELKRIIVGHPNLFEKYLKNKEGKPTNSMIKDRNVIIPYFDQDGLIDRVLLRQSDPEKVKLLPHLSNLKEVNCLLQPQKQHAKDYFVNVDEANKKGIIVMAETALDTLSFREIDKNADYMAPSGVNHLNGVLRHIKKNKERYQANTFVMAFDNDKAGRDANKKVKEVLDGLSISNTSFYYGKNRSNNPFKGEAKYSDPNEFLQKNRVLFEKIWVATKSQVKTKEIEKEVERER